MELGLPHVELSVAELRERERVCTEVFFRHGCKKQSNNAAQV